ncbi:MAG: ATP F0F1 synthase subunit B [Rickettsiales bacterium]|nr:ATP F0F1 synthase subunit B [Rickettsiales bacterium]
MFDAAFFVAVAFFMFLALAWKPVSRILSKTLDVRAARIEAELAEAVRLREEAQATLLAYQKKQREANTEAEAMLDAARQTAKRLEEEARIQLQQAVDARITLANEKIAREEQEAVAAIQRKVVEIAVGAARDMLSEEMNDEANEKLIALAIKDSGRTLH